MLATSRCRVEIRSMSTPDSGSYLFWKWPSKPSAEELPSLQSPSQSLMWIVRIKRHNRRTRDSTTSLNVGSSFGLKVCILETFYLNLQCSESSTQYGFWRSSPTCDHASNLCASESSKEVCGRFNTSFFLSQPDDAHEAATSWLPTMYTIHLTRV